MAFYWLWSESSGELMYAPTVPGELTGYQSMEQTNMSPASMRGWAFSDIRNKIKKVFPYPEIGAKKIIGLTSMEYMFYVCHSLTSIDLSGFDTSQVTSMGSMFDSCSSLTSIDLSGFDTSQVTYMYNMFSGCSSLTSLDLSGFDTSQVTDMISMFVNCSSLTSLDLSGFDTSQVTNMSSMFSGCSSLRLLAVGGSMSNVLSQLPASQYYPASGGSPVAKASLTAGTWVRDEADLSKVATIVEQAQAFAALRRDAGRLEKRIAALSRRMAKM